MRIAFLRDPDITYYRRVLKGVAQFVRSRGNLELHIEQVLSVGQFKSIDRAGYDGLLLGTEMERLAEANRLRTPAVSVSNTFAGLRFPRVVTDDYQVGRIVARHLLDKGYRQFAFWGDGSLVYAKQRWSGFAETICSALGKEAEPARNPPRERSYARWLERLPRPLGLMTATDASASDLIEVCRQLGRRVPADVAVVGVDDDDFYADLVVPPLSSVAQQTDRIGYLAAECLLRLVQGEAIPPVTLVPPGPLVARQSSQAMASVDELLVEAARYLEGNLARGVNVAELARALGVSRRTLELRFRAGLGRTPGQELARLKIERAQGMLAATTLPLKEIATLSGFGTAVRMSQAFRHYTGQTPMGYRRGFTHQ